MNQARKGLDAASAADRILETLLSIVDRSKRLAMVPEAFSPPPEDLTDQVGLLLMLKQAFCWCQIIFVNLAAELLNPCKPRSLKLTFATCLLVQNAMAPFVKESQAYSLQKGDNAWQYKLLINSNLQGVPSEEELVYTSPLRLLQVRTMSSLIR